MLAKLLNMNNLSVALGAIEILEEEVEHAENKSMTKSNNIDYKYNNHYLRT